MSSIKHPYRLEGRSRDDYRRELYATPHRGVVEGTSLLPAPPPWDPSEEQLPPCASFPVTFSVLYRVYLGTGSNPGESGVMGGL